MGYTQKLGLLAQSVFQDSSLNVGIGAAPSGTYKFEVTGTAKISGVATFGSTLSNGTYAYTLPSATGTLALTSALGDYLPLTGGTLTGGLGGTTASFSSTITSSSTINAGDSVTLLGELYWGGTSSGQKTRAYTTGSSGSATLNYSFWTGSAWVIKSTLDYNGAATFSSSVTATGLYINSTGAIYFNSGLALFPYGGHTYIRPYSASGNINFQNQAGSLLVTMLDSGNVGIGTSSPSAKLHIKQSSGGYTSGIWVESNVNASELYIHYASAIDAFAIGATYETGGAYKPIAFFTSDLERMRITSGGNVLIGTTTDDGGRLTIKAAGNTSSNYAIVVRSSTADLFYARGDGYLNTGLQSLSPYFNSISGRSMIVDSGGGLGYLVSTRESKANIKSINGIDYINQLNPVQFNYRKKDNLTNEFTDELYNNITYGFIADEVEKVNKELVFYNGDKLAGVEYNSIIAILTKAVQEQQKQIEELKLKIK